MTAVIVAYSRLITLAAMGPAQSATKGMSSPATDLAVYVKSSRSQYVTTYVSTAQVPARLP